MLAFPWNDRAGRLSPLKLATFVLLLMPGLYLAGAFYADALGAKPVTAAIHDSGKWAVRILLFTLAVSPMRRIADWPRLILIRRMLGLAVLAYALIHLGLYIADQNFKLGAVASEIALRLYLTIGFVALVGLVVLGATSTGCISSPTRSRSSASSTTSSRRRSTSAIRSSPRASSSS